MLVIHPDECIDCGVCEPECPIDAILPDSDEKADAYIEMNRKYSIEASWPVISIKKDAMADAEKFKNAW